MPAFLGMMQPELGGSRPDPPHKRNTGRRRRIWRKRLSRAPRRRSKTSGSGALQIRVAALCTLVQICDGYDINSIGVAVPSLTHAWNLPGPAFTQAFLWSSIGILVGALSAGPIGDRFGRKPLLLGSLTIFGLASLLSGLAGSLPMLSVTRFFTGIGIGGAFPGAASLTGDYAPQRRRATMIMASFTGAPLGGFLCGQIAGLLLPNFGWPSVFFVGGVVPLVMVAALAVWLPESPRFLATKARSVAARGGAAATPRHRPGAGRRARRRHRHRATRSRCCSARAMRCRPCCCGSCFSAA